MESLVILGSGPAGLTAALYAGRAGYGPLVLEGPRPGGAVLEVPEIMNYPGFPDGVAGFELVDGMRRQAVGAGARFTGDTVERLTLREGGGGILRLAGGAEVEGRVVVVATGIAPRPLGLEGEGALTGRGVSYCATCDAPLYRGREVLLVGEGGGALREAVAIARVVGFVTVLCPLAALRATAEARERAEGLANLRIRTGVRVVKLETDEAGRFVGVVLEGGERVGGAALFVLLGVAPATRAFRGVLPMDGRGFLRAGDLPKGIYAAGDVCSPAHRQVAVAVGTGCVAAMDAVRLLGSES